MLVKDDLSNINNLETTTYEIVDFDIPNPKFCGPLDELTQRYLKSSKIVSGPVGFHKDAAGNPKTLRFKVMREVVG